MIELLRCKLHGLRVTDANLQYRGSITIDAALCEKAGLFQYEFVQIWNKSNGERMSTYVIYGKPDSHACILNGAAARKCQLGDELIVAASILLPPQQVHTHQPRIVICGADNSIQEIM